MDKTIEVKKPKNNLTTLSYFRKRLKDAEIKSVRLINNYSKEDERYWTILIDPGHSNLLCTCYKKSSIDFYFNFNTDKLHSYRIETKSMEIVVDAISKLMVGYGKKSEIPDSNP